MSCKVKVYVQHGYFEYEVNSVEKAMAHGEAIMSTGVYRSSNSENEVVFHKVFKVKVEGENIGSEYKDTFKRT